SLAAAAPTAAPVEVTAAVDETGHWLMEARFLIFHESDGAWSLTPDADSPVLALTVDGDPVAEFPPAGRVPLLFPPPPGTHEVWAVWRSPTGWDADQLAVR